MSDSEPNACQRWIGESVGRFPSVGYFEDAGPFQIGVISIADGLLSLDDLWSLGTGAGLDVNVKPGRYAITAMGADFGGHRRIASVQVLHEDAASKKLKFKHEHDVPVDSWGIAVGEFVPFYESLSESQQEALAEKLLGVHVDGCDLYTIDYAGKTCTVGRCFTGFGDGTYPIDTAWRRRKCVGLRCTFLDSRTDYSRVDRA